MKKQIEYLKQHRNKRILLECISLVAIGVLLVGTIVILGDHNKAKASNNSPIISLKEIQVDVKAGSEFDKNSNVESVLTYDKKKIPYSDKEKKGAYIVVGNVNTKVLGKSKVVVKALDEDGNEAIKEYIVHVVEDTSIAKNDKEVKKEEPIKEETKKEEPKKEIESNINNESTDNGGNTVSAPSSTPAEQTPTPVEKAPTPAQPVPVPTETIPAPTYEEPPVYTLENYPAYAMGNGGRVFLTEEEAEAFYRTESENPNSKWFGCLGTVHTSPFQNCDFWIVDFYKDKVYTGAN